jgi:hypothetical protein
MRKSPLLSTLAITAYLVGTAGGPISAQSGLLNAPPKLDSPSQQRGGGGTFARHRSRIDVRALDLLPSVVHMFGGTVGRSRPSSTTSWSTCRTAR